MHFVVRGPEGTPYEGGFYHGKLVFPSEFPFKPPSIYMITPNGRFKCNTRLCLSISDFHPDTWNPAWSVSTILTGLLSFMVEKNPTLGSIETSDFEKRQLALQSLDFNLKDPTFCEMFPEVVEEIKTSAERLMRRNGFVNRLENDLDQNNPDQIYQEQAPAAMGSTLTNIFVIMGFAVFAYVVKYVLSIVK
ncbi:ubiquitin-conjugating enzyme E2 J2-like isoform X2 [Centruroides sculpturatus]|uniref:ubiquitin-conjugating enzyme E2 J2-like isoform X2 n=1 Tax=Centruroides sculpturatus TaxID=218467 RepID=UPI000C6E7E9E|nr:ubiquitin-conjugating enzyme E2 J2-like isoform X2 [Centruroides sculpturatus]